MASKKAVHKYLLPLKMLLVSISIKSAAIIMHWVVRKSQFYFV